MTVEQISEKASKEADTPSDANKNGCEVCKKMAKLITGIL